MARRTQSMGRKQVAEALASLEKWQKPYVYLSSWEHYDVSSKGMSRADWLTEASEYNDRPPYLVQINTGGYTGVTAAVVAGHPDEALETADEWAATKYYDGDREAMHEAGEGPLRVDLLASMGNGTRARNGKRRTTTKPRPKIGKAKRGGKKTETKRKPGSVLSAALRRDR